MKIEKWIEIVISAISLVLLTLMVSQYLGWLPYRAGRLKTDAVDESTPATMYSVSPLPTVPVGEWYDVCPPACPETTPLPTLTPEPTPTCRPTSISCPSATPYPTGTPWPVQPADTFVPTLTPTYPPSPLPSPTPTSEPTAGKPFGVFNWVPGPGWPFTATRLGRSLADLERARQQETRVLVALTGSHGNYTDESGCFDLPAWRDALDRSVTGIQSYVNDGTIYGLYAVDEPHDWENRSCGPDWGDLNSACSYAHSILPGIRCGYNAPPSWLHQQEAAWPGDPMPMSIDFIFIQTNFLRVRDGPAWAAWANEQLAEAAWSGRPVWLSINAYTGEPTAVQIRDAAIALCESEAVGVMIWKWGQPNFEQVAGMREAMEAAAEVCVGE